MSASIPIPEERIGEFCRKWGIQEFSLFGSVLRDDFRPDSDVDVLVAFERGRTASLEDWLDMLDELRGIFGREIDLVERRRVTNPFRRYEILTNRRVIYAA
ncbi:MAG TPA: nucleotidyltransferase domain-containing protein [Phycisphaerales bacterium]|nr:nucleotidyltransferase domain-containing protein [Phycisphaerales bacterium]